MADEKKKDPLSGVETTGHEWDGLRELNNPAPRWWLWVFIVTVIWSIGYWVIYPAWPTISGATKGNWEWTQYKELKDSQSQIIERRSKYAERFHAASLEDIRNDPELYEFARVGGAAAFKENCAACHGTGAAGGKGYPNLNDDDWLWGGTLAQIHETISVGVNSGHDRARGTQMPAFGRDGMLTPDQINDVVEYVEKLHLGDKAQVTEAYTRGEKVFADNCAACHAAGGTGNTELGAPRLNDEIWLWGGDRKSIHNTVVNAHTGVMPAWDQRMSADTIKALSVYVHSLGGGKEESTPAAP
jgi:cytochrome c oxidase cbb3-type subunit 3